MMKNVSALLRFGILFCISLHSAKAADVLEKCWSKQVQVLQEQYLRLSYDETRNRLYHSFEPWQKFTVKSKGLAGIGSDTFFQIDSIADGKYISKTQFTKTELLYQGHGDTVLSPVSYDDFREQIFETARYSPGLLIDYFIRHRPDIALDSNAGFSVYKLKINKTFATLFIRNSDQLAAKLSLLNEHPIHGDVLSTFDYSDYSESGGLYLPKMISIGQINGRIQDEVHIRAAEITGDFSPLFTRPEGYEMKEETIQKPEITVNQYNDRIHFIQLRHTDAQAMLVEFSDFLLVAEAALNSENGELIINEARKIASGKPVRYFTFGHFHPHYMGGVRAFVHKGATILCLPENKAYLEYMVNAGRTLNPDSLHLQPRPLISREIKDSATISDGKFSMKIYSIGKRSEHSIDFTIFYFPEEKMLFQGELVWIKKEGEIEKAGKRQLGLYNVIRDLKLDVQTIVQSWPLENYGLKYLIPFHELELSVSK